MPCETQLAYTCHNHVSYVTYFLSLDIIIIVSNI